LTLDVTNLAKLASAFQLLIFALVNLAVIIMRESEIDGYDPGFRSPLYPWLQIFGVVFPFFLIAEMGWLSVLNTLGACALGAGWYYYFARGRVVRDGAIYHLFARLGRRRFDGLDVELRGILQSKGLRPDDPYDEVVLRAFVIDVDTARTYEDLAREAGALLARRIPVPGEQLAAGLMAGRPTGLILDSHGVALPHYRVTEAEHPELVLVRCAQGLEVPEAGEGPGERRFYAVIFLASPEASPGQHLRILAQIALHVEDEEFLRVWLSAGSPHELRETLLRDDRSITLHLDADGPERSWVGRPIKSLALPPSCLIALIRRGPEVLTPKGDTVLQEGDRITVLGDPRDISTLHQLGQPAAPD